MQPVTIYTPARRAEVVRAIRLIPAMLSGRAPDSHGLAHGFAMRLAFAWLMKIKLAFIVKSRGGTDEAGISWAKLSKEYLAYSRGPKSTRTAGGHAPGGKDGYMSAAQLRQWQAIYARNLARLAASEPIGEAKAQAAQIAWATMKKLGVKTKLEVLGNRDVEILRDRGILFNSLSPGTISDSGIDATYTPPSDPGGESQVVEHSPGEVVVGTNVAYAAANHKKRPLWPEPDQIPQSWWDDMLEHSLSGVARVAELLTRGRAA